MKDDADAPAEFNKEPMVVDGCVCATGVCPVWSIPEYKDWDKLGLPNNNNGIPDSCCGEGSGVFNTPCPNLRSRLQKCIKILNK
ncbi:MAG: hypothetical protein QXT94_00345 [Methanothrix sp.]